MCDKGLQIVEKRREVKDKRERERYSQLNAEFQRTARSYKKACLSAQCKEIEENNRQFRYDLNQILYDYTGEVRNRFKGLDLIDRVPEVLGIRGS